jgi:phospholipase/carboxylesterase
MTHVFVPGETDRVPVVLLHGSGGDEHELISLAARVARGSQALGIRGSVPFEGGFAFFHRRADRSIDEADLSARVPMLVELITAARDDYQLSRLPVAIGFSNGAIMTAALLMAHPGLLAGAVLFRPLSPFAEDQPARLNGTPVLVLDGEKDSRRLPGDGARLAERLTHAGATVTHHVLPVGHAITDDDEALASDWLKLVI